MAALWNKLWSFIKEFAWVKVIKNFNFFLQTQLAFLRNICIRWCRLDYVPFQWWRYLQLFLHLPNMFKKSYVREVALVMKWHPAVLKILFEITFCTISIDFIRVLICWSNPFINSILSSAFTIYGTLVLPPAVTSYNMFL